MTEEIKPVERPEWLPEKFTTVEQMAESYKELERIQSGAPATPLTPAEPLTPNEVPPAVVAPIIPDNLGGLSLEPPAVGDEVDFAKYDAEILSTGDLSPESYAEIVSKFNIPEPIARSYVSGKKAEGHMAVAQLVEEVGGMENYKALQGWALGSLSEVQRAAFNTQLAHPDADVRAMAVRGLYAQYQRAAGNPEGGLVQGTTGGNAGVALFRSEGEFQEALRDPRWSTDSAYRAEVQDRARLSLEKGTITNA